MNNDIQIIIILKKKEIILSQVFVIRKVLSTEGGFKDSEKLRCVPFHGMTLYLVNFSTNFFLSQYSNPDKSFIFVPQLESVV